MPVKRKVVAAGVAALAVGGTGAGIAATKMGNSPSAENKAIVDATARNLGIEPSKLTAALEKALEDRVDAAVAAGRLTKAEGDQLKQRIESGDLPFFAGPGTGHGFGFGFGHRFGGPHGFLHGLDAAATYLGLSETQLQSQLESGKTLAEIAKAQNKSVDGLKSAMNKDAQTKLDQAVKDGRLSKSEEQRVLSDLQQRIDDLVNGKLRDRFPVRPGFGFRRDRQGPPPFSDAAA
jgi:polyhydroxyalkanoate synthesis regulator phasin